MRPRATPRPPQASHTPPPFPNLAHAAGSGTAVNEVQQLQAAAVIGVLTDHTAQLEAAMTPILANMATTFSLPLSSLASSVDTSAAVVTITNPRQAEPGPGSLSGGARAGIIVGCVVAATLVAVAIVLKTKRTRQAVGPSAPAPAAAAAPAVEGAHAPPPDGVEMA